MPRRHRKSLALFALLVGLAVTPAAAAVPGPWWRLGGLWEWLASSWGGLGRDMERGTFGLWEEPQGQAAPASEERNGFDWRRYDKTGGTFDPWGQPQGQALPEPAGAGPTSPPPG